MPEILIVGSGALALFFGSRLARAGVKVSFLGTWEEGLAALDRHGIRVADPQGIQSYPARVERDLSGLAKYQQALVLVKSWQTERAAEQLSCLLSDDGIALTLQNGFGNREILSRILGEPRTAQGVTTYGANLVEPGLVRPGGAGLISLQIHPRLTDLVNVLQLAELAVQQVPDLASLVWGKMIINIAINPLTALLDVPNGHLLESTSSRSLMGQAALEGARVAHALGVKLQFEDPARAAEAVAESTAANISSMLQDLRRGAPTEIEMLCGAVVELGKKHQVETPLNLILLNLIRSKVELGASK